ncbi:MAG TPA: DUF4124 domain-containing protein [Quisquiliibacterium sp.]|nr:DUF4124 domain-containing protein [Quisquiliibacterium sp.]
MNTRVLLLGCLLALSVQAQESKRELWKWKDANGVTQYSDRPVPGATKVELYTSAPAPAAAPAARPVTPAAQVKPAAGVQYQSLEIWQPESGESFFGADATVNVRMRSEPSLAAGDRLLLYLDGKLVEGAANSYEHTLSNLERGVHSLAAVILDDKGNEKIRSEPRVFHIKLPTTVEPRAVGPALRPQPPPRPQPRSNSPK